MTNKSNNQSAQEVDVDAIIKDELNSVHKAVRGMEFDLGFKTGALAVRDKAQLQSKAVGYSLEQVKTAIDMARPYYYHSGKKYDRTNEISTDEIIQSLTPTPIQTKGREVEFGKWLSIHCSDKCDDFNAPDGSLYYFDSGEHLKTIEELFQLFLTTNPSNKGA